MLRFQLPNLDSKSNKPDKNLKIFIEMFDKTKTIYGNR